MSTVALQISGEGLSWSRIPDPLSLDEENEVAEVFRSWPRLRPHPGGTVPRDMEERLLTYRIVALAIEDADEVYLSVTDDADRRRVGIAEVALETEGCRVETVPAHPDGAAGIVREMVDELVSETSRPPGM